MERTHERSQAEFGSDRHTGKRSARGWILALALLGFGAGAIATAAGETDGRGAGHHGYGMPEPAQRQGQGCQSNVSVRANARMQSDSDQVAGEADASKEASECIDAVSVSAMHVFLPLQAGHYLHLCAPHGHLCNLIAAHARVRIGPVTRKRTDAAPRLNPEPAAPLMRDTLAANYAAFHAQRRTARTGRFQ